MTSRIGEVAVLDMSGELDLATMSPFVMALESLIAAEPRHLIFDLSNTDFICSGGYAAIGRASLLVNLVSVCSKNGFEKKILRLLGFDRIIFFTSQPDGPSFLDSEPTSEQPLGPWWLAQSLAPDDAFGMFAGVT